MRLFRGETILSAFVLLACAGCAADIGVEESSREARRMYGADDLTPGHLSPGTVNLLGNFLLAELYEKDPAAVLMRLEELCKEERRRELNAASSEPGERVGEFVCALADLALAAGLRFSGDPELSIRYFLAAALYSGIFLKELDDGAASELVVRSGHSVHCNPLAIQEVRKILLLHAGSERAAGK